MSADNLDTLFTALRAAGLPAGPTEVLRIQRLLELDPEADRERLGRILAAVVVKSTEQRERFDAIFDEWFAHAEEALDRAPPPPRRKPSPGATPSPVPLVPVPAPAPTPGPAVVRRAWLVVATGAAVIAVIGAGIARKYLGPGAPDVPDAGAPPVVDVNGAAADAAVPAVPDAAALDAAAPTAAAPTAAVPKAAVAEGAVPDAGLTKVVVTEVAAPDAGKGEQVDGGGADQPVPQFFTAAYPVLTPDVGTAHDRWMQLAAGFGALAVSLGIWLALRSRPYLPDPEAPASRPGPLDTPFKAPSVRSPEMLDPKERDALVWGIGQFASEQPAHALDVESTVKATAGASGIPVLHFQREKLYRSVSLWVDDSAEDPALRRFADEIAATLARAGLPVEIAHYWAVPDRLVARDGSVVELEERRSESIVAVLTDGRTLAIRHAVARQRDRIHRLLRALSRWPRLAFVDFGHDRHGLAAIVGSRGVAVIDPGQTAMFLAEGKVARMRTRMGQRLEGDALAWAAACALAPRPVDEETALGLRRALDLRASPWVIGALARQGGGADGRIDWALPARIDLCNWLRHAERAGEAQRVDPGSLLGRALAFWRARYDAEGKARAGKEASEPWAGTPAERMLRIERALLDLWDRPDEAAGALYPFAETDLGAVVKRRLSRVAPLEREGTDEAVVLPWRLDERPPAVRVMLRSLSFGAAAGVSGKETLRRPGRLGLALGLCGGLGVGAAVTAMMPREKPVCEAHEGSGVWCEVSERADGRYDVVGGRGGFWASVVVDAGQRVVLELTRKKLPCVEATGHGAEIVRCGKGGYPSRGKGRDQLLVRRRVAVLDTMASHLDAKVLAERLIDSDAMDAVLVGDVAKLSADLNALLPPQIAITAVDEVLLVYANKQNALVSTLRMRPSTRVVLVEQGTPSKPFALVPADGAVAVFMVLRQV